ncbi:MAG: glycosyltransferase family 9 protein [Terriglobales bacterium]
MASVLPGLPAGAWVALIRLRSLGDTLLITPALHQLKSWRPDLRLAVLVEPRFQDVLAGNPGVDRVVAVPAGPRGRLGALAALRRLPPALVIGLHGGSTAAWLARCSGAPQRATFLGLRHRWAYPLLTPPPADPARRHAVEQTAALLEALGMPAAPLGPLRVFPTERARTRMRQRLAARGLTGRYAFLNTEAREPGLRWPLSRFGELAARLKREHGLAAVQASASAGEPVEGAFLVSGTSVAELIALLAEADLVIGNDGGPIHIAAALGKPVLALYSTTDVPVWSPWQTPSRWLQSLPLDQISAAAATTEAAALLAAPPHSG